MEFKDGFTEVLNKQRSEEQTLTSEDMGVEKGKSQEEKMVRTKAYGGKEGMWLGSQSNRAPTERKGRRGSGVPPCRVMQIRDFCLTQEQQKF